jgi:hypothetical protein
VHLQFEFTKVQIPSPITGLRDDLMLTFEDVRVSATENRTPTRFSAGLSDCRKDRRHKFGLFHKNGIFPLKACVSINSMHDSVETESDPNGFGSLLTSLFSGLKLCFCHRE